MPTYTYECPVCGRRDTAMRTIEYRDDAPRCRHHETFVPPMQRVLDAPAGVVDGPAVPRGNG